MPEATPPPLRKRTPAPPPIASLNIDGLDRPDMMQRVAARFSPGSLILTTCGDPLTARQRHCTIHLLDVVNNFAGPLRVVCGATPRHAVGVLGDPTPHNNLTDWLLAETSQLNLEPCRLCRRCFPYFDYPDHDHDNCAADHQLSTRIAAELSAAAVAVIAGLVAPHDEGVNVHGINPSPEVWEELRRAFPTEKFWTWAEENNNRDSSSPCYDPDRGH